VDLAAILTVTEPSSDAEVVTPRVSSGDAAHRVVARRQPCGPSDARRLELAQPECLCQVRGEYGPRGNSGRTPPTAAAGVAGSAQSRDPRAPDADCQPNARLREDQKERRLLAAFPGLPELQPNPQCIGIARHMVVNDAPAIMANDEKAIQDAKA